MNWVAFWNSRVKIPRRAAHLVSGLADESALHLTSKGIANHDDPESCVAVRKGCREALIEARAGSAAKRHDTVTRR